MVDNILNSASHLSFILLTVYAVLLLVKNQGDKSQTVLAVMMLVRNSTPLLIILVGYGVLDTSYVVLQPFSLFWGVFIAAIFSSYPLAVLRPRWISFKGFFALFLPLVIVALLAFVLRSLGMIYTPLHNFGDILDHIQELNVQFRVFMFFTGQAYMLVSVVYMVKAVVRNHPMRQILILYTVFFAVMGVFYAILSLRSPKYGILAQQLFFFIIFSIITYELVIGKEKSSRFVSRRFETPGGLQKKTESNSLEERLNSLMLDNKPYYDSKLTLPVLAHMLGTNRTTLSNHLRGLGYKRFQDYLNYYRIEEFKFIVQQEGDVYLEEVYHRIGFGSRNTFYRNFKEQEGMTPGEYLQRLTVISEQ